MAINEIGLMGLGGDVRVKQEGVLKALTDRLVDDEDSQSRSSAALALHRIGEAPGFVIDGLIAALDDAVLVVRSQAVSALGALGAAASRALPRLRQIESDAGPLAATARNAVEQIGRER